MPQIDLGPNDYRKQDRRTGQWRIPDDPKLCRNMFMLAVVFLIAIFWNRDALSSPILFGDTALIAFAGGIMFAIWLKDVY